MIKGMEREQFLKFRMALLPASGFQSAQFRMIELYSTPLENLVSAEIRNDFSENATIDELYENIYWKKGGIDLGTGEKTLTLKQFEKRYTPRFLRIANGVYDNTIYHRYLKMHEDDRNDEDLVKAMRNLDVNVNINWLLMHMGAAYRYLSKDKETVKATGGTNWKKFLPPSFQRISFFPELWNEEEKENWGKQWVNHTFNTENNKLIIEETRFIDNADAGFRSLQ